MTSTIDRTPVLIAGAGPSGLVLALTLAQNKVPVRIIEKELVPPIGQRGSGIQPRSLELFHFLGVLPDIQKLAIEIPRVRSYKMPEGEEPAITYYPVGEPWKATPDIPYPNAVFIGQSCYEGILREHLARAGVTVEFGKELTGIEQEENGVTATVVNHNSVENDKPTELISADWLVCANGGRSTARKALGLAFLGETQEGVRMLLTDIEVRGVSPEFWHAWGNLGGTCFMIRATEDPSIFTTIVTGPPHLRARAQKGLEGFVDVMRTITNRKDIDVTKVIWQSEWRPNVRIVENYRKGMVFLIGDAAHIHTPTGGQGANAGMQDALNLGWKLALVHHAAADPSLLDTYNEERYPVAKEMLLRTSKAFEDVFFKNRARSEEGSEPVAGINLDTVFKQLRVSYRWSSIVSMDQQHTDKHGQNGPAYLPDEDKELRAGDRAPDAPGLQILFGSTNSEISNNRKDTTSLFNIFHPARHTLLLFSKDLQTSQEQLKEVEVALAAYPLARETFRVVVILPSSVSTASFIGGSTSTMVLVDVNNHAHTAYHHNHDAQTRLIVVRPDGVIGAVLQSASDTNLEGSKSNGVEEGLKRYLRGVFRTA
ncbi:FAD binding domain-containing protein [Irpex lacteus]|nr:FAD binding domain-containing protein [Irpex lacteus]